MKAYLREFITSYVREHNEGLWRDPAAGFADGRRIDGSNVPVVIVYFIPFSIEANERNRKEGVCLPGWVEVNRRTHDLIDSLNDALVSQIGEIGFDARPVKADDAAAYLAGLGTYGLHGRLITLKGASGMFGAVAADAGMEPDRPMTEELCLYKSRGICGICIKNCAAGAVTPDGRDAEICADYAGSLGDERGDGFEICGKCLSFSPCAYKKG